MSDRQSTGLRRLLSRSNSTRHAPSQLPKNNVDSEDRAEAAVPIVDSSEIETTGPDVSDSFLQGCDLLRVTRKKARTRRVTIESSAGTLSIDGIVKFHIDAMRDIRIGADASHYRELCKISAEHQSRWLSIVYYLDNHKLKVLHFICASSSILSSLRNSLIRLYQRRSSLIGAGHYLFSQGSTAVDEDMWHSLIPTVSSQPNSDYQTSTSDTLGPDPSQSSGPRDQENTKMSFSAVEALCQRLRFNVPTTYLAKIFQAADRDHTGYLDFPAFKNFVGALKDRHDIGEIYRRHKHDAKAEMSREDFITFMVKVQGHSGGLEDINKIFERAREPTSEDKKESISATNFAAYVLSRHNSLLNQIEMDMSRPLNEYFISSSHNTYLMGRQVGDESSIEPYIRALQKGCRCIEIDVWANSENYPEVRHGHAFTSSVSLESVLRVVDKYAFIVSPWPLIISLEIRCSAKAQEITAELLSEIFGEVLVTHRRDPGMLALPSPEELKHRILLKVKSANVISEALHHVQSSLVSSVMERRDLVSPEEIGSTVEDSSVSTSAAESDQEFKHLGSRSSSISSRSSSYSNSSATKYRPFTRSFSTIDQLTLMAPYMKGIKFRNFSLPESKAFSHVFSFSERALKSFSHGTSLQLQKHNTRFLTRIYPSQARLMSSNFLPHYYWQQGAQMVALNWQTHDLGMRINESFFAMDEHSAEIAGYIHKPKALCGWQKGQENATRTFQQKRWDIEVISGTQLSKGSSGNGKTSPLVEVEIIRPMPSSRMTTSTDQSKVDVKEKLCKFRTPTVEDNGFNPRFNSTITFNVFPDEDPFFTFIQFSVKDALSNEILGQYVAPLARLNLGYRSIGLFDSHGERYLFSSLFVKIYFENV